MIYIFIMVCFSSNIMYSLKEAIKSFISLFYFGVAIVFINNYKDLNKLFRAMIILSFLFILNLIIANIFHLGGVQYSEDETNYLETGNVYSEGLNAMAYYLVLLPAIIQLYSFKSLLKKRTVLLSSIVILILLLVTLKRGALLVVFIGYLILISQSEFKQKKKLFRIIFITFIALVLLFPIYENMLKSRFNARKDRMQVESYESEMRYRENFLVINDIFFSGNVVWLFFGHEMFNSPGNYGGGVFGPRQLHNDYAQVLNGSGILGLGLYFLMNFSILMYYLKLKKRIMLYGLYTKKEKMLNAVFLSYFIAYFALCVSGSVDSVIYNAVRFIFLGAIIGVFKNIPDYYKQSIKDT